MKKVIIRENSIMNLEDQYIPIAEKILKENPQLPIQLNRNVLSFDEYTVGIIRVNDLLIEIKPRNDSMSINSIFEMFTFVNSNINELPIELSGFELNNSFEFTSITYYFFKICYLLLSEGLTGTFKDVRQYSKNIRGSIVMEEYVKQEVSYRGLPVIYQEYSINSVQNQIIKAALRKIKEIEQSEELINKINLLLREFEFVENREFDYYELLQFEMNYHTFYSPNRYYPIVLETSIKILKDLKISYNNGFIEWYSFLVNSNDIFEKYVRKLLSVGLQVDVLKWNEPKPFAAIKGEDETGYKSFSPDILIDYNEKHGICRAVLDVKNKIFNPSSQNITELVSSSDLYQIIFYCRKLKTNIGAIIYPTNQNYQPFKIEINDEDDPIIYLISINMSETFENRYNKLIKEVKMYVLDNN